MPHHARHLDREEFLNRIQENGGARNLDLSGYDISLVDIDQAFLEEELARFRQKYGKWPHWVGADEPPTLYLAQINLEHAALHQVHLPEADFFDARLLATNFARATLSGASMMWCDLRESTFITADLTEVDFYGARLDGADFDGARMDGVNWEKATLNRTRIAQVQLEPGITLEATGRESGNPETMRRAAEIYVTHKLNFISLGRFDEAAWAHVRAERVKRLALWREFRTRSQGRLHSLLAWFLSWGWDRISGYGQTPQRPLVIAGALTLLMYPLIYWLFDVVEDPTGSTDWWDCLVYSTTTFGTLSFNNLQPTTSLGGVISATEAFFGVLAFAVFVFVLGNRLGPR